MTEPQITEEDRRSISAFVESPAYKKLVDFALERARAVCEAPSERILYSQGICGGIREFCRLVETYAKPPVVRNFSSTGVFEKFRSRVGRSADYGPGA